MQITWKRKTINKINNLPNDLYVVIIKLNTVNKIIN